MTLPQAFLTLGLLGLGGCAFSAPVPFPVTLPSQRVIDIQYHTKQHDLAKLKKYHFSITLPDTWSTLDTVLVQEPTADIPEEIAAFREPGEWMKDPAAPAKAEVSISVLNLSGSLVGSGASVRWLTTLLDRTVPGYRVLNQRDAVSNAGPVGDVLIRYNGPYDIIARFFVIPMQDKKHVIVLTASAPASEYADRAMQLYVALQSFHLK
mgnify:CR=1 FL=1